MTENQNDTPSVEPVNLATPSEPIQPSTPKLAIIFILVNAIVSLLSAATALWFILVAERALSSVGYSGFMLILMPIPMLLAADGIILLTQRKSFNGLFSYYSIARTLFLLSSTYFAYKSSAVLDTEKWVPLAIIFYAILTLLTAVIFFIKSRSWLKFLPLVISTIISIVVCIILALTGAGLIENDLSAQKADAQISYDLQLLQSEIEFSPQYPKGTAKDIALGSKYGQEFKIYERAAAYTYIPLPESKQFKLCATFATDSTGGNPKDPEYTRRRDFADSDSTFHKKGYQCFTYDMRLLEKD